MRVCEFCGAALQAEAIFCGSCGRRQRKGPSGGSPGDSLEETRVFRPEELWPSAPAEIEETPVEEAAAPAEIEETPAEEAAPAEVEEAPAEEEPAAGLTEQETPAFEPEGEPNPWAEVLFGEEKGSRIRGWWQSLPALAASLLARLRPLRKQAEEAAAAEEIPVLLPPADAASAEAASADPLPEESIPGEHISEAPVPIKVPGEAPPEEETPVNVPPAMPEVPAPAGASASPEGELPTGEFPCGELPCGDSPFEAPPQGESLRDQADYFSRLNQLVENPALELKTAEAPPEAEEAPQKSRAHWWILGGAVLLLLLLLGGGLLWYHEPVRSFERAFSAGDYAQALQIYNGRALEKENKAAAIQALLDAEIAAIYQEYLDEQLSAAEAKDRLQTLNGFPFLGDRLQEQAQALEAMEASRKAFAALEQAIAEGDHLAALELAEQVLPEDANYPAAQALKEQALEAHAQLMLDQARDLLEAGNYDDAFAKLVEGEALLGALPQFQSAREEFYHYINNLALDEAAAMAAQSNYSAAVSRLKTAAEYLGEEHSAPELLHKIEVYTSYIPVSLMELSVYATNCTANDQVYRNFYLTDNQGKSYGSSLSMTAGSITYQLGGKYRSLSGVVAFPADATSSALAPSARLEIYGDGALIWASGEMSGAVSPVELWVDVQPYDKVALKWVCTGLELWNSWGYYATLFSPMLQPVPIE
ncbi:MAG: NPCBM/NEW2 domain-containing protein [Firmicutes bacterium]|nr:NPCBM/NEW2 domain-containing protein [Bacillota bacterium]